MGIITSFTRPSAANFQSYIETIPARLVAVAGAAGVANQAIYWKVRVPGSKPMRISQATWYNGAVAGNVDAGIGTISGTTFSLVASTGSTAMSGANQRQTANLTSSVVLIPDTEYYMSLVASDVATATFGRYVNIAALGGNIDSYFKGSALPFVDGATVAAGSNGIAATLWLRMS